MRWFSRSRKSPAWFQFAPGRARAYVIPTDAPEADGTFAWDSTTIVVVQVQAGDASGVGYTYGHATAAAVAQDLIEKHCVGTDAMQTSSMFSAMRRARGNWRDGVVGRGYGGMGSEGAAAAGFAGWLAGTLQRGGACVWVGRVYDVLG